MKKYQKYVSRQSGSSLIEVMVALLIFSTGMLGVAGLQGAGIRAGEQAAAYSLAAVQINDIVARMRANDVGMHDGKYDDAMPTDLATIPNCVSVQCSSTQISQYDLLNWNIRNAQLFPSGAGKITAATATAGETQYQVALTWLRPTNEDDTETGGSNCANDSGAKTYELAYCVTVNFAHL